MRPSRPEAFSSYNTKAPWQYPYNTSYQFGQTEAVFRAGSAPYQEEKVPKRAPGRAQRIRHPVRVIAMQSKPKTSYKKDNKKVAKPGEPEDDLFEHFDIEERPPCRQNTNLFDFEDTFYPKMNGFLKESSRGIRADIRPPSRHKTPPKALGLELPPKLNNADFSLNDNIFQDSPMNSTENESLSNTLPANINICEPKWTKIENQTKPKSAKGKKNEKFPVRMWSAAKNKQKLVDVPITLNKREKVSLSFSSSRREKKEDRKDEDAKGFSKNSEKREFSSQVKTKAGQIVPFQTNLDSEFLNLFAKSEDFNF